MSFYSPITSDLDWVRSERKHVRVQVKDDAGQPVNLAAIDDIEWVVSKVPGGDILLRKAKGVDEEITIAGSAAMLNDVAVVLIEVADYALLTEGSPSASYDVYWHELWDRTSHLRLAHGEAFLHAGAAPEES